LALALAAWIVRHTTFLGHRSAHKVKHGLLSFENG